MGYDKDFPSGRKGYAPVPDGSQGVVDGRDPLVALDAAMADAAALQARWADMAAAGQEPGKRAAEVRDAIRSALADLWRSGACGEGSGDER